MGYLKREWSTSAVLWRTLGALNCAKISFNDFVTEEGHVAIHQWLCMAWTPDASGRNSSSPLSHTPLAAILSRHTRLQNNVNMATIVFNHC